MIRSTVNLIKESLQVVWQHIEKAVGIIFFTGILGAIIYYGVGAFGSMIPFGNGKAIVMSAVIFVVVPYLLLQGITTLNLYIVSILRGQARTFLDCWLAAWYLVLHAWRVLVLVILLVGLLLLGAIASLGMFPWHGMSEFQHMLEQGYTYFLIVTGLTLFFILAQAVLVEQHSFLGIARFLGRSLRQVWQPLVGVALVLSAAIALFIVLLRGQMPLVVRSIWFLFPVYLVALNKLYLQVTK